jgi:hypothetical protein
MSGRCRKRPAAEPRTDDARSTSSFCAMTDAMYDCNAHVIGAM